ncbi:unnamed protein product [Oppiella nova]|uniref:Uncharacterized protein n=1 Tax=Oppiella nova TaxID=334625 RepID=A0A7R9ME23_9ACAR|nr:unnamed protein product [Oppiella nova]CAG2175666.1 unnamed protein product [Oppiella nova]
MESCVCFCGEKASSSTDILTQQIKGDFILENFTNYPASCCDQWTTNDSAEKMCNDPGDLIYTEGCIFEIKRSLTKYLLAQVVSGFILMAIESMIIMGGFGWLRCGFISWPQVRTISNWICFANRNRHMDDNDEEISHDMAGLNPDIMNDEQDENNRERRNIFIEVQNLIKVQSEYVVRVFDAWKESDYLYIQMELCSDINDVVPRDPNEA